MVIEKIKIQNYKIFKEKIIELNENLNIFVGENDAGKSTILEVLGLIMTGKINGYSIEKQINTNLFNNECRNKYIESIKNNTYIELPDIIIEAYCKNEESFSSYKGTNNSLSEDCPGIMFKLFFDSQYSENYKMQLQQGEISDIPLEFYKFEFKSFDGRTLLSRQIPFKVAIIDTSKKDYTNLVNKFVSDNIAQYLSEDDQIILRTEYRKQQLQFRNIPSIKSLNEKLERKVKINDKAVSINTKEMNIDKWKEDMEISIDKIPFGNLGFGSQNTIKIELALNNDKENVSSIIIEEPENNLSYGNMNRLISKIEKNSNKQIFISSHSSFVANKLGLDNIILVHEGNVRGLKKLDEDTKKYFKKLPGYDTLRIILANEVILVEGPADDLIVQRAYKDVYGRLPIEDGIDIIALDSLSFKRYCDIAILVNKKIKIITDNDGNIKTNIFKKYEGYIEKDEIEIFYEKDENFNTLEPSVLNANMINGNIDTDFKIAISKNNSMCNKSYDEIKNFMINNKTEWSMRVFDYENKIKYPQYIMDAIKK